MSDKFITYIEKDIDNSGSLQEIDLHDRRINTESESTPSSNAKGLIVNSNGTITAQQLAYLLLNGNSTMQGEINMGSHKITNLSPGVAETDAINFKQLIDAIAALGTVFRIKGVKETADNLPTEDNQSGDVWYVKEDSSGYVWINKAPEGEPAEYAWEKLGPAIDFSIFLKIADLASTTGNSTQTAMTQKAVTDKVNELIELIATKITLPNNPENGLVLTYSTEEGKWIASPSLALGETETTAYRGDRGKTAYDHASAKGSQFASGMYKITTNAEGHVTDATAVVKADITGLGIPGQDTNTTYTFSSGINKFTVTPSGGTAQQVIITPSIDDVTTSAHGLMTAEDKTKLNGIASGATAVNESTVSEWGFTKNTGNEITANGSATRPVYISATDVATPCTYGFGIDSTGPYIESF